MRKNEAKRKKTGNCCNAHILLVLSKNLESHSLINKNYSLLYYLHILNVYN